VPGPTTRAHPGLVLPPALGLDPCVGLGIGLDPRLGLDPLRIGLDPLGIGLDRLGMGLDPRFGLDPDMGLRRGLLPPLPPLLLPPLLTLRASPRDAPPCLGLPPPAFGLMGGIPTPPAPPAPPATPAPPAPPVPSSSSGSSPCSRMSACALDSACDAMILIADSNVAVSGALKEVEVASEPDAARSWCSKLARRRISRAACMVGHTRH